MGGIREPRPDLERGASKAGTGAIPAELLEHRELVGTGASEQCLDQAVFRTEEKEEHPRARSDRGRQGAEREVGQAVGKCIAVGGLEELELSR